MTDPSAQQAGRVTLETLDATVTAIRRTTLGECAFLLVIVVGIVQAVRSIGGAHWTTTLLASLLMAPLGWRYYFCWAIGPLTGYLRNHPPTPALASFLVLWAFTPALSSPEWSALTGATLGSAVFWTTLALWAALLWLDSQTARPI